MKQQVTVRTVRDLGVITPSELAEYFRRVTYDLRGEPGTGTILFAEHPPGITFGRDGSAAQIALSEHDLRARQWGVDWVARGGGVLVHGPGQLACYPLLPLEALGLTPFAFVRQLTVTTALTLRDFSHPAEPAFDLPGVTMAGWRVADIGVAVRHGISSYGITIHVATDAAELAAVRPGPGERGLANLSRETAAVVSLPELKKRLLERLAESLGLTINERVGPLECRPTGHVSHSSRRPATPHG